MVRRVGLVFELLGHEPAVLCGQRLGNPHHARSTLGRGRQHQLGAEKTHQFAPLDGEGLGHHGHERITLDCANHREGNACIAGSRLHHGLSWRDQAVSLGVFDDADGEPVLDGTQRIECLELDVHIDAFGRQPLDAHNRRAADGLEHVVVDHLILLCSDIVFWQTAEPGKSFAQGRHFANDEQPGRGLRHLGGHGRECGNRSE